MGKNKSAYYANIAAQQKAARQYVETALKAYYKLNPDFASNEFIEYATQILSQAFRDYGDQAAVVACQEYDSTMRELGFDVAPADIENDFVSKASLENSVKYFNSQAAKGTLDFNGYVAVMVNKTNDHVRRAANKTIVSNADRTRDRKAGVRYARIPTGRETCGFCLLLASRGFVYKSKASAGYISGLYNYYHDFCDCAVVAGTYGTTIDGYDPEWYYEVYKDARKTAGVKNSTKELNKVVNEINRRNREWMWGIDKAPKADYSLLSEKQYKNLKQYEIDTWDNLASKHGIIAEVQPFDNYAKANIDARINGLYYELKNPGNGKHSMEDLIRKACHQWRNKELESKPRVVICNSRSSRSDADALSAAIENCSKYGVGELLFVSRDYKTIRRISF